MDSKGARQDIRPVARPADSAAPRDRARMVLFGAVLGVFAVVLFAVWWFASGQSSSAGDTIELRPLERSGPEESILRVLRLAGVERATVGEERGTVVVRVVAPALATPAHAEIAWQAAVTAAAVAYPSADEYVVQLFSDQDALVELTWDAKEAGAAISADDAAALREAADIALIPGAVEISEQLPGDYIDEKNRVTGFSHDGERFVGVAEVLRERVDAAIAAADGVPAPPPSMDAGQFWASLALGVLDKREGSAKPVEGIREMAEALKATPAGLAPDRVAVIRARAVALSALVSSGSESVLAPAYELAGAVTGTGPTSDVSRAILLEAAGQAPEESLASDTTDFSRSPKDDIVEASDAPADPDAEFVPVVKRFLFASEGLRLIYLAEGERHIVETDAWLAYRRGDGRLYWLPEGGSDPAIALTDGSLRGWLWTRERMAVVDAKHVGSVSALLGVR